MEGGRGYNKQQKDTTKTHLYFWQHCYYCCHCRRKLAFFSVFGPVSFDVLEILGIYESFCRLRSTQPDRWRKEIHFIHFGFV